MSKLSLGLSVLITVVFIGSTLYGIYRTIKRRRDGES
ncbi:hypothetical protein C7457_1063 [Thermovibrio guaymasensis]|uniref:Uncharacterized protein n=1 Tax=Thermovibrio guaymasensis TaxID=240167 RepID=A0A420W6F3_9BACT|nr:hypothetical protein C7457_1063 [Thermovibrio guaymasensis]